MKLDEAIKRASEVADTKLQDAELSEIQGCYNNAKKNVMPVPKNTDSLQSFLWS